MNRFLLICIVWILLLLWLSCEDREATNPYHNTVDLDVPKIDSISIIDDRTVELHWTYIEQECSQFIIYRWQDSIHFQPVAFLSGSVSSWQDTGLSINKTYYYAISIKYDENESNKSESKSVIIRFYSPSNLTTSLIDDQSIQLSWQDNSAYEQGFRIERNDSDGFVQIATVNSNIKTYVDVGLIYGKHYTYRVKAFTDQNESGCSNESNTVEVIIPEPSNLTITIIDEQSVHLTWTDNCSFEAGYKVERREEDGIFNEIADLNANIETLLDQGLDDRTYCTYRVYTYTSRNQSDYSNIVNDPRFAIDIDGNRYKMVKIGSQVWMAENLKVIHYQNGDLIPHVIDNTLWATTTGAYCRYNNNDPNAEIYGNLYNWYAVNDSRNIAPIGWHVPTDDEWKELEMHLGITQIEADDLGWCGTDEGSKLKSTSGWTDDGNGTDDYGFSALPGGYRGYYGSYNYQGNYAFFWSATEQPSSSAWRRNLHHNHSGIYRHYSPREYGFSVRCIRD